MENFRKAYINEDAIKNFREQARLAAAKERVVHASLTKAAGQMVRLFGPNISLDASKDTLTEIRPDVFTGKVEAQLSVETGSGLKRVAYPIDVRSSVAILKDDVSVKAEVEDLLHKTESEEDKHIAQCEASLDEKANEVSAELEKDNNVTSAMENEGLTRKEAEMFVFNKKAAASAVVEIAGPGPADDAYVGINALPQNFIQILKVNLPTFAVGDPLDLNGVPYVCVKVGDVYYEFQIQVL